MFNHKHLLIGVLFMALLFAMWPNSATAGNLPPRPTAVPTSVPPPNPAPAAGALIELRMPTASLNYFTVVQWQSIDQVWHTVESWQGNLDDTFWGNGQTWAYKRWWVNSTQFGQKNFRWQVYDRPHGKLLVTSSTFDLPTRDKQQVIVQVALP
jgi:hypothetical protein